MEKQSLRDSCRIIKRLDLLFSKTFSERRRKKKANKSDMLNYTDQRTDNKINLKAKDFGLLMEAGEYLGGKGKERKRKVSTSVLRVIPSLSLGIRRQS